MAKASVNRKLRRVAAKAPAKKPSPLTAVESKLPELIFPKSHKVKVKHAFQLGQGAACVGSDNKVYIWNAYVSGWLLNEMSADEKLQLRVATAYRQAQQQEKQAAEGPPVHIKSIERQAQDDAAAAEPDVMD